MAKFFTVAQFKAAVAAIPAGFNANEIEIPDGLTLAVISNRTTAADGTTFLDVRGYAHVADRVWEATGL